MRFNSCRSCCSFTELAVGLTCWAMDGAGAAKTNSTNAHAPTVRRVNLAKDAMSSSPIVLRDRSRCRPLDVDSLAIGGLPAPRPGPVAALHHTFFVNLGND